MDTEIKALRAKMGISYKDASHRLYMSTVEKLNIEHKCQRKFKRLTSHLQLSIDKIRDELFAIENESIEHEEEGGEMSYMADQE